MSKRGERESEETNKQVELILATLNGIAKKAKAKEARGA